MAECFKTVVVQGQPRHLGQLRLQLSGALVGLGPCWLARVARLGAAAHQQQLRMMALQALGQALGLGEESGRRPTTAKGSRQRSGETPGAG